jgi:hypothetical protein
MPPRWILPTFVGCSILLILALLVYGLVRLVGWPVA